MTAKLHLGKYIQAIGVELEGGWSAPAYDQLERHSDVNIVGDGSVHCNEEPPQDTSYLGEVIPREPFVKREALKLWVETNYPQAVPRLWYEHDTCGFHIHLSFRTVRLYQHCMCHKFFEDVYTFWEQWGRARNIPEEKPFWHRIRGEAVFCRRDYHPETQKAARGKGGEHRYEGLNYCFGYHGTMELRLLPMFDTAKESVEAALAWVDFVEGWLAVYREEADKTEAVVDISDWVRNTPLEDAISVEVPLESPSVNETVVAVFNIPNVSLGEDEVTLCA